MSKQSPAGSRWYRAGAWLQFLVGLGHLISSLTPARPAPGPEEARIWDEMAKLIMPGPGPQHSLMQYAIGWSATMGTLYVGLGLLNVVLERSQRIEGRAVPASVTVTNILITLAGLVLAALHFPPPPVALLLLATVAFGVAWFRGRSVVQ